MPRISDPLRTRLIEQRRELMAAATHPYMPFELEALRILQAENDDHLLRASIRRWWLQQAGDLDAQWPAQLRDEVKSELAELRQELGDAAPRPAWIQDELLVRTIDVLQRRSVITLRPRAAVRALRSVGRLALLGVQP